MIPAIIINTKVALFYGPRCIVVDSTSWYLLQNQRNNTKPSSLFTLDDECIVWVNVTLFYLRRRINEVDDKRGDAQQEHQHHLFIHTSNEIYY